MQAKSVIQRLFRILALNVPSLPLLGLAPGRGLLVLVGVHQLGGDLPLVPARAVSVGVLFRLFLAPLLPWKKEELLKVELRLELPGKCTEDVESNDRSITRQPVKCKITEYRPP